MVCARLRWSRDVCIEINELRESRIEIDAVRAFCLRQARESSAIEFDAIEMFGNRTVFGGVEINVSGRFVN